MELQSYKETVLRAIQSFTSIEEQKENIRSQTDSRFISEAINELLIEGKIYQPNPSDAEYFAPSPI